MFIQDWTVPEPGKVCDSRRDERCSERVPGHCHLLLSDHFKECHKVMTPSFFYEACMENSCDEEEACEIIASYTHLCREYGACVDWRTPEFCRKCSLCAKNDREIALLWDISCG